jgi:hypothetical protein
MNYDEITADYVRETMPHIINEFNRLLRDILEARDRGDTRLQTTATPKMKEKLQERGFYVKMWDADVLTRNDISMIEISW